MVRRGEIYYANLSPVVGSEQGGRRPVLIVQNDVGNRYSPTVVVAAITAQISKGKLPTHAASLWQQAEEYAVEGAASRQQDFFQRQLSEGCGAGSSAHFPGSRQ